MKRSVHESKFIKTYFGDFFFVFQPLNAGSFYSKMTIAAGGLRRLTPVDSSKNSCVQAK